MTDSANEAWRNRCREILDAAAAESSRMLHGHLGVEHLFLALLGAREGAANLLLQAMGAAPRDVAEAIRRETGTGGAAASGFPSPTARLKDVLGRAGSYAEPNGPVTEVNLLRAMFEEGDSLPVRYLSSLGYRPSLVLGCLEAGPAGDSDETRMAPSAPAPTAAAPGRPAAPATAPPGPPIRPMESVPITVPTPTLDQFGRDLAKLARMGRLSDALGREAEIEQMITILARTQKANPLILGEAGVGKTAVVEGLAWRMVNGRVPAVLRGKRIVELTMGALEAGTSLRGQFEERVRQVLAEATSAAEVILFIDEIHTIMGAGGGGNDAAQMFKPALARGDVSCIGATTQDEYAKFLRKDPALERRFSPVTISELSTEATLEVLRKIAPRMVEKQAAHSRIEIDPEALAAAVSLTARYVKDRQQPDKSIDALDIACARAVVKGARQVRVEDIAAVVSEWTGIPAGQLGANEQQRFMRMEAELNSRIIGQEQAVRAVSRSVRAAMAGLKPPNRPIGVFLFMGPSGVGKTHFAKELAAFLFRTPEALVRFDMNEYQEKSAISNLMGSARGYIGSDQGGQFTEAMRRRPYSVVLFDEIEKAHPDIYNSFLAVFDDGRITDNTGRVIDCSNAVFILTSNLGMSKLGYTSHEPGDLRSVAMQFLRPELVNRVTEVVGFSALGRKELARILDRILREKTSGFRAAQRISVSFDESVNELLLETHFDPRMGARPLEREVDKQIVQPLVDAIFEGRVGPGEIQATVRDGAVVFEPLERV